MEPVRFRADEILYAQSALTPNCAASCAKAPLPASYAPRSFCRRSLLYAFAISTTSTNAKRLQRISLYTFWKFALMCFSAAANFVGSAVLGGIGVVTLTKVRHRRELMFASLPTLFAIHHFTEGFVWLGLDGYLSPAATHYWGEAFMLYAQGLLPFLLPLSVQLFEPNTPSRKRMVPFTILGGITTLYMLWAL